MNDSELMSVVSPDESRPPEGEEGEVWYVPVFNHGIGEAGSYLVRADSAERARATVVEYVLRIEGTTIFPDDPDGDIEILDDVEVDDRWR